MCALGGGVYIVLMMAANLVGFSFGVSGLMITLNELLGTWAGISIILKTLAAFTSATFLMFFIREDEEAKSKVKSGY